MRHRECYFFVIPSAAANWFCPDVVAPTVSIEDLNADPKCDRNLALFAKPPPLRKSEGDLISV